MKSRVKTFSTIILIFLFSTFSFSQATITIKLLVDTANFDASDLNASCSFEATWSNSDKVVRSNGNLEDFVIEAFVDDTILWDGVSTSSDITIIDIKKIKYNKGTRIFKNKTNYGKKPNGSKNEKVEAKVLHTTKVDADYKYDLTFRINNRGETHTIDPKVRIKG